MERFFGLVWLLVILPFSNCLYFILTKSGGTKWFNYDLSKSNVYIGEYQLLDYIQNIEATGDGVRVNFYEPDSKNYYTKVFQGKDRQVFNARTKGVHKVCFEGTKNLFISTDQVRVSVKMYDEVKFDKKLETALKDEDFKGVKDTVLNLQATLSNINAALKDQEAQQAEMSDDQDSYDSSTNRMAIFIIMIVLATGAAEIYLFKQSRLPKNMKKL